MSTKRNRASKRQRITPAAAVPVRTQPGRVWAMLVLAVAGIAVAGYLAITYFSNAAVVCYGVGQCEAVQGSAYSHMFGLPIAYFGLLSFLGMAVLLAGRQYLLGERGYWALLGALALAVAGTVFSAYLTYVEFFVINAVCPWCLTSAAINAVLAMEAVLQVQQEVKTS